MYIFLKNVDCGRVLLFYPFLVLDRWLFESFMFRVITSLMFVCSLPKILSYSTPSSPPPLTRRRISIVLLWFVETEASEVFEHNVVVVVIGALLDGLGLLLSVSLLLFHAS